MKFFAYAVGALALAAVVVADTTRDDLLKDASKLRGEAASAIEKLKSEGKDLLAHEIEVLEKGIETLENKVEELDKDASNPIVKIGLHAAETVLKSLEERLKHKIEDLTHGFDNTKEDLLKDAAKLKAEAAAAIALLKGQGKGLLAHEIEILEGSIENVEKKVEKLEEDATNPIVKIGLHAAETVLKGLEERLKHKIEDLTHGFDSTKEELLKDAAKLRGEASAAIEKLKKEGKGTLALELKALEDTIINVEHTVEMAHPTSEIGKVALHAAETVLQGLEHKLEAAIKKLSGF
jgi:nucleotidyltransferase/DNA polymerase involved in DNA repair